MLPTFPFDLDDGVRKIGVGTASLYEALRETLPRRNDRLQSKPSVVTMKVRGETTRVLVVSPTMLLEACRLIRPRIRRRELLGLRLALETAWRSLPRGATAVDDVAFALAGLFRETKRRARRPVMRSGSVGGKFDSLHCSWFRISLRAYIDCMTTDVFHAMAPAEDKKQFN